jgi:hypothetical protein
MFPMLSSAIVFRSVARGVGWHGMRTRDRGVMRDQESALIPKNEAADERGAAKLKLVIPVVALIAVALLSSCTIKKSALGECSALYIFQGDMVLSDKGIARLGSTYKTYVKNQNTNVVAWQKAIGGHFRYLNGQQIEIGDIAALEVRVTLQEPAKLLE